MSKYVTFFVVAVCLGISIGRAASAASPGDGPRTASANEQDTGLPDWMTSYYQNPQPDRFVSWGPPDERDGNTLGADAVPPGGRF